MDEWITRPRFRPQQESFGAALRDYLIDTMYSTKATRGATSRCSWTMNHEWYIEVRKMADPNGHPVWEPPHPLGVQPYLFGCPVVVDEKYGAPRLERL